MKLNPTVCLRRLQELKCKQCDQIFYTDLQLERHKRLHSTVKKPFLCDVCGVTSTTRYFHHLHIRSHGRYPYQCNSCSKSFPKLNHLNLHQNIHGKEKALLVQTLCPQSVTSQAEPSRTSSDTTQNSTLYSIVQLKLEDQGPSTVLCSQDTAGTPLPVPSTAVDTQLKVEKCIHNNDGPFACQMCGSHFTSCYLLDEHQQRRTGKYPCCMCSRNFKTLSGLRYHALRHDKKPNISDQPSCHSGTALIEPKMEPLQTALSSDTSLTYVLDHSVEASPMLNKDTDTFRSARAPRPFTALTPLSQCPVAPPSVVKPAARTPPQLRSGPTPAIFSSFKLTSAFLEVKWNYKLLQERAASKKY